MTDRETKAGAAEVGSWFDPPVAGGTIAVWRQRAEKYGIPCPKPTVEITTAVLGVFIAGWDRSQKQEWLDWHKRMPGLGWAKKDKAAANDQV